MSTHIQKLKMSAAIALSAGASVASAFPSYLDAFQARYPTCTTPARMSAVLGAACYNCHHAPSLGDEGTCYRLDLRATLENGNTIEQALAAIEFVDSDGDGVANIREILAPRTDLAGQVGFHPGLVGPGGNDPCLNPQTALTNQLETPVGACYANCDGSTATALSPADFTCFLTLYRNFPSSLPADVAVKYYANCDGSTGVPVLSPADFTCFLQKYRAGCP